MPTSKVATGFFLPTGKDVYDALMGLIEPELVTAELPRLEERFTSDSPDDRKARMQRYAAAFKAYEKAFADYIHRIDEKARSCAKLMRENAESRASEEESVAQENLLSAMSSL